MTRMAIGFIVLLAIIVAFVLLGAHYAGEAWSDRANDGPPWASDGPPFWIIGPIVFWSLVIGIIVLVVKRVGRSVSPMFDLIDASNRLSAGDYSVRVDRNGQRNIVNVIDAFNSMAGKLEESDQQRRRLLADIAHELRTPLAVIQGNVEGMIDQVYPRDDGHLEPLLKETQLISRLLDDLQTLARAESGTLDLFIEPTDLGILLTDIVASFRPSATSMEVTLTVQYEDSVPEVELDPVRMRQVLENLLANALRYTESGGEIRLDVESRPAEVAIRVSDDGVGISPDLVPHIFDRFVKAADSGGSGLGLAIAKRIVEAHGGSIGAISVEGEGTTITLTLPSGSAAS